MRVGPLALVLVSLPAACDRANPEGQVLVDAAAKEVSFSAIFHRANAEEGTWHLIVQDGGSMASKAFFTTDVSPGKFYELLKAVGASDGNNVTDANFHAEDIATQGDEIEFTFEWEGQAGRLPLHRLIREALPGSPAGGGERGLEFRFGGNYTAEDAKSPPCHESGCLACLYTCSAGVTSNSRANAALLRKDKHVHRYRVSPEVQLADGARVRIHARRK